VRWSCACALLAFWICAGVDWIVHEQVFLVQSFAIVKIVIITEYCAKVP
jgi:hypothetical protein